LTGIASAVGITSVSSSVTPSVGADPGHLGPDSELPFGAIVGIIAAFVLIVGAIAVILLKRTPSPRSLQRHWVYEDEERIRSKA
jgi:hypothetical protein